MCSWSLAHASSGIDAPPHPFCTMVKQTGLLRTHHNMPSHLISCHTPTANKTSSSARRRTGTRVPGLCVCGLCVYPLYLCNTCFPLLSVGCVVQRASTWWCVCPVGPKQRPVYMWIIAFGCCCWVGCLKIVYLVVCVCFSTKSSFSWGFAIHRVVRFCCLLGIYLGICPRRARALAF